MSDMDFYSHYKDFEEHADEYYDERGVELGDLFDPEFMKRHTEFDEVMAFLDAAPPDVEKGADFERLNYDDFDPFVDRHTEFYSFVEMFSAAVRFWTYKHYGE